MSFRKYFDGISCLFYDKEHDIQGYTSNFGNLYKKKPSIVAFPETTSQIQQIIHTAVQHNLQYTFRGAGHSLNDACLTNNVLITCQKKSKIIERIDESHFEIDASVTWAEAAVRLNEMGRSVPVLTSELGTTIGGTLSSGGFGEASIKHGSQVHQVSCIELILPSGEILNCSLNENPSIFQFCLAGLGQLGYINKVILNTIPYTRRTNVSVYTFSRLSSAIVCAQNVVSILEPDYMSCRKVKDYFELIIGLHRNQYVKELDKIVINVNGCLQEHVQVNNFSIRSLKTERMTTWDKDHYYIFCDHIIPSFLAVEFSSYLEQALTEISGIKSRLLLLAGINGDDNFPLLPINRSIKGLHIGFGLYFAVHKNEYKKIEILQNFSTHLLKLSIQMKGRPYLTNSYTPSTEDLRNIYGKTLDDLKILKAKLDPNFLCNNHFLTNSF